MIVVFLLAFLLAAQPDCGQIEALTGGVELNWLGYEAGGWDLPDDLTLTARIDFAEGGLWEYVSDSVPERRWLYWFGDYEVDGTPLGAHHFCAVTVTNPG